MKTGIKKFIFLSVVISIIIIFSQPFLASAADRAEIWDNGGATWTTTFANGDPVDTGTANDVTTPQIAVDSTGNVYTTFVQAGHIYLSRYDGTDVRIWDNDTASWTTTFANGDPIDLGTANAASAPQIAIDSTGKVYVTYIQSNGSEPHIYLSRYDGTDVRIWDNGGATWTTTFANGDPIDKGTAISASVPQIAVDSTGKVYVTYIQANDGTSHVFLSRYDGTDVRIWDNGTASWTTTFANGDPIDTGMAGAASVPQLAIDSTNKVYIAYEQNIVSSYYIYLSRYDGTDVRIWDNGGATWTTTFANGDPIDTGSAVDYAATPQLAIDSTGKVYVTYVKGAGTVDNIFLSRYNGTNVEIWDNDTATWITTFANGDPIGRVDLSAASAPQLAIDSTNKVYITYFQAGHTYLSRYNGTDVRIWDVGGAAWTTTFANGDQIDNGTAGLFYSPQMVVDSANNVYLTYRQSDFAFLYYIYLYRYDGVSVKVWDKNTDTWTATFADGDSIDNGTAYGAHDPMPAVDLNDNVYLTYPQLDGAKEHIYLSRLNANYTVPPVIVLPTVTATSTTLITATTSTLHGEITATGGENNTVRGFEYGTTTDYGLSTSTTGSYGIGTFNADLTGLDPSTTYHFRAYSTNSAGTGTSTDLSFDTSAVPPVITLPTATSSAATSITTTGATLHGNITALGGENNTVRGFEYGTTTAYGTATSTTGSYSTGTFSADLTGLSASTTYHFRSFSTNSAGTSSSTDVEFITEALPPVIDPPTVTASDATSVTTTSATLNGEITATGGENNTSRGFEYGTTTAYGTISSTTGSYNTGVFSANLTGLTSNTAYHFRSFSVNSAGTATSSDASFTTDEVAHSSGGHGSSAPPSIVIPPVTPLVISPPVLPPPIVFTPEIPIVLPSTPLNSPTIPRTTSDLPLTPDISSPSTPTPISISTSTATVIEDNPTVDSGGVNLFDWMKSFMENNTVVLINKIVTAVGLVTGGLATATNVDFLSLPFKLWGLLLSIFGLKKRNRPWGTVYDSITKQPIDPAYVTLTNLETKEENTSITDLDGRYGFLVNLGKYILTANKTNYTFPSQRLSGKTEDTLYNNLYFGEEMKIETDDALISKNIPLDPIKFDWNEFVKGKKKLMRFYSRRNKVIRIISDWMFRIGFVFSILSLFFVPAPYNLVIFFLYVLLVILRKFGLRQKALGSLTERDGSPLSFAIIRVFDSELNVEITNKVADKIGRYYCLVSKGKYYVKVEKKNDDESYSVVYTSEIFEADGGIINRSFVV